MDGMGHSSWLCHYTKEIILCHYHHHSALNDHPLTTLYISKRHIDNRKLYYMYRDIRKTGVLK